MIDKAFILIMAGGRGERFWPLSTEDSPKPFIKLIDGKSLIELTYQRALKILPKERIFFVVGERHLNALRETIWDLDYDQVIVEPEGRDTASCIGFSALFLKEKFGEGIMAVFPADHYIGNEERFLKAIRLGIEVAQKTAFLVTFGIKPRRPETGYGYIKAGEIFLDGDVRVFKVERFVEKPTFDKASEYLESGFYYWNSGMFVWRISSIIDEMRKYLPEILTSLEECVRLMGCDRERFRSLYSSLQRISIDYGVMEKTDRVLMVEGDFLWDDVGSFASLYDILEKDEEGNVKDGEVFLKEVKGSIVLSYGQRIGVVGLSNVIVVATKEGVVVAPMDMAQAIRDVGRHYLKG